MRPIWAEPNYRGTATDKRSAERRPMTLPALLTWKDQRGSTRFASVVTRDVSEYGVFVETVSPVSIPLYRLVQFQLDRDAREAEGLPLAFRQGRLLSAVYRVHQPTRPGARQGLALRLMVDPKRRRAVAAAEAVEAVAIPALHAGIAEHDVTGGVAVTL